MSHSHEALIWTISAASIFCVLLRPAGWSEAWWAAGGALLLVLGGLLPLAEAGAAIAKGCDVYLFLLGMMILSELARVEGVFDWIAQVAATHAAGSASRLFLLIYLSGTVVTAFLSNDATAVVLTPAVLTIVRHLKVAPAPHLLACAFIANAASFILPISNPANLVIYGRQMPPLLPWLAEFGLPSLASVVVTFLVLRFATRADLRARIGATVPQKKLSSRGLLALGGILAAAAALMTASFFGQPLGLPTCAAALLATGMVAWIDRSVAGKIIRGVAWSIIPLVAGLFVIVGALEETGLLELAQRGLESASRLAPVAGHLAVAFSVALLSNGMNNLPVGLIGGALAPSPHAPSLSHALLVGVDLGPNLSVTGSLATILWLIALRREKVEISGWRFFKIGLFVMPLALLAAILLLP
jgi:arsenical pump membrane protein